MTVDGASLKDYLGTLQGRPDQLRTVSRPTDPDNYEVTALLERLERRHEFPAVLFRKPLTLRRVPSPFSLLTNLWATRERCAEMLGLSASQTGNELGIKFGERLAETHAPVVVPNADAPAQTSVWRGEDADLRRLPVVRHFEKDLGPVLTMGLIMRDPGNSFYNVTFAKSFPGSGQRAGITIHTPDMSRLLQEWGKRGERAPIVNVLGHHPLFWMGSLALTPYGTNEYTSIGGFMGAPLRLTPSVTWGDSFLVPADAEMVVEAELVPGEQMDVNPFGEVSRLYQTQQPAPVIEVKAITYRPEAIVQDVFSGHREHWLLGLVPREGSIYRRLQAQFGNIGAVHLPFSGFGRMTCYISVRNPSEGQPKAIAMQALAAAPMCQMIVVVDDEIDVFNEEDVLWAINVYLDPATGIDMIRNMGRVAKHSVMGATRILIDATRPRNSAFPERLRVPPDAVASVDPDEWLD